MLKKTSILFIAIILVVNNAFSQRGRKGNSSDFYTIIGAGKAFGAGGRDLSKKEPTLLLEVGCAPEALKGLTLGVRMRSLQYSPALLDSSMVIVPKVDSLTPGYTYYKDFYHRCATLLLSVGASVGNEKGFTGGINIGVGVAYVEINDRLGNFAVGELTLEGGYNFSKNFSFIVQSTYHYLWHNGNMLSKDGYAFSGGAGFKLKFGKLR